MIGGRGLDTCVSGKEYERNVRKIVIELRVTEHSGSILCNRRISGFRGLHPKKASNDASNFYST